MVIKSYCEKCNEDVDYIINEEDILVPVYNEDIQIKTKVARCSKCRNVVNNGDLDDAVYYIERAYELDPQDEITIACLRELDKYR